MERKHNYQFTYLELSSGKVKTMKFRSTREKAELERAEYCKVYGRVTDLLETDSFFREKELTKMKSDAGGTQCIPMK